MNDRPWATAASEPERWAGYFEPGTQVLRNLADPPATSAADLQRFEDDRLEFRMVQLRVQPIEGNFDLEHLQAIHHHLFQDVYPWAGELRTVGISKGERSMPDGTTAKAGFLPIEHAPFVVNGTATELRQENYLRGLSNEQFADRLAVHFNAVNEAHVFREGNGRAARALWDQLAEQADHVIHWRAISAEVNVRISHEARVNGNLEPLRSTLRAIVSDAGEQSRTLKATEAARLATMDSPTRPGVATSTGYGTSTGYSSGAYRPDRGSEPTSGIGR